MLVIALWTVILNEINQRLPWIRHYRGGLGFFHLHIEADLLGAAGCRRSGGRGLGKCECCNKHD